MLNTEDSFYVKTVSGTLAHCCTPPWSPIALRSLVGPRMWRSTSEANTGSLVPSRRRSTTGHLVGPQPGVSYEAYVPTKQPEALHQARIPQSHVNPWWPSRSALPSSQRPRQAECVIDSVRDRATFRNLRVQGNRGRSGPIRAVYLPHDRSDVLVAFAISRKFGPAVQRNRARRRLRAAVRHDAVTVAPGVYLFSCQREVLTMPFTSLLQNVQRCVASCEARAESKVTHAH